MRDLPDDDGIREPLGWARVFTPRRMWLLAGVVLLVIAVTGTSTEAAARRAATATARGVVETAVRLAR